VPGDYRIVESPIDLDQAIRAVSGPDRGAVATFIGVTRDRHDGRRVKALEYHAYPEMAERVMREIGLEVEKMFGTPYVAILHRIGLLNVGEPSVVIAVAAAHRREALAGCAHAIDRLKETAPIWKKEHYDDGASWIEGTAAVPAST
jgi:MoaE-MoaD fusion protein